MRGKKISRDFYLSENIINLSKELLGKLLCTYIDHKLTSGMIVEVESYKGVEDVACHAYKGKRTLRTEVMFEKGGKAYVYLIYGIYNLFNVITAKENIPHAILIRAVEPKEGLGFMKERRKKTEIKKNLTSGPGLLTQALGINLSHNKTNLNENLIWIEEHQKILKKNIIATPRVGLNIIEPYKSMPWRFYIKDNKWISFK
jgi:DNA-3-methyladenine glycosylase